MAVFQYGYRMVYAILWKCWRVRKRHWIRTCAEIFIPVLLVLLLVTVKAVMERDNDLPEETASKPTQFIAHDMKVGRLQKISFICTNYPFMQY